MIATSTKTNLVDVFGLKSGTPFRVNLSSSTGHGENHKEQLRRMVCLVSVLSDHDAIIYSSDFGPADQDDAHAEFICAQNSILWTKIDQLFLD